MLQRIPGGFQQGHMEGNPTLAPDSFGSSFGLSHFFWRESPHVDQPVLSMIVARTEVFMLSASWSSSSFVEIQILGHIVRQSVIPIELDRWSE